MSSVLSIANEKLGTNEESIVINQLETNEESIANDQLGTNEESMVIDQLETNEDSINNGISMVNEQLQINELSILNQEPERNEECMESLINGQDMRCNDIDQPNILEYSEGILDINPLLITKTDKKRRRDEGDEVLGKKRKK